MVPSSDDGRIATRSVSVVVPTHERPVLVTNAVRAIVQQNHPGSVEVLVVFDKSEPHPIDVPHVANRTVRALVNDRRRPGLAGARNTGILAARGDYVAFCDDDDEWLPGKLAAQFDAMDRSRRSDAVIATGIVVVSGDSERIRRGPTRVLGLDDFLRDRIMEVHPSTLLFPREVLVEEIGLVDEDIPGSYAEDYELLLRATRNHPVINVPQPLVRVAFHPGSFYASKWQTIIDGLQYVLNKYPEFDGAPAGRARIRGQIAFAEAALGRRSEARRTAVSVLRDNYFEKRAYAALLVAAGVPARSVSDLARRLGRGI